VWGLNIVYRCTQEQEEGLCQVLWWAHHQCSSIVTKDRRCCYWLEVGYYTCGNVWDGDAYWKSPSFLSWLCPPTHLTKVCWNHFISVFSNWLGYSATVQLDGRLFFLLFADTLKIVSAKISKSGAPLVVLANRHAFVFDLSMQCWQRIVDDQFYGSSFYTSLHGPSSARDNELASLQAAAAAKSLRSHKWNRYRFSLALWMPFISYSSILLALSLICFKHFAKVITTRVQ
jgi:hypothetical protein